MKLITKSLGVLALLLFLPAFGSGERLFAPGADLWERWQKHDAGSTATVDHSAWTALLKKHLSPAHTGVARLDYKAFAGSSADRAALKSYLSTLASTPVSTLNRDEQMAFWINAYNALTVEVVLDAYPVVSIRDIDISPGLLASGPWGAEVITVEGEDLTKWDAVLAQKKIDDWLQDMYIEDFFFAVLQRLKQSTGASNDFIKAIQEMTV